jgi:protein arginine kinase
MKKSLVKTTIVLSRNMDMHPFPTGLTFEASEEVENVLVSAIEKIEGPLRIQKLVGMNELDKEDLFDEGLITYHMMRNRIHSSVIPVSHEFFYRLNNEDHLEIIGTAYTGEIKPVWQLIREKEERLSPKLNFAYDTKLGYLTSRITEVGTGLKIFAILHLPGIVRTGYIDKLTQAVHQVGYALKEYAIGGVGHGGGFFELSNSITIGKTELELVEGVKELIDRIDKKENDALGTLLGADDKLLEDELYRAYGLLQYARIVTYEEAIHLLSKVRLGITLEYFKGISLEELDRLLFQVKQKNQKLGQAALSRKEDVARAEYIRAHLYGHQ